MWSRGRVVVSGAGLGGGIGRRDWAAGLGGVLTGAVMKAAVKKRYEMVAQLIRALGHPVRVAIVDLLDGDEACVGDLVAATGCDQPGVSRHLSVLLQAGVVKTRKEGLHVYYSLRTPCVVGFLSCATKALTQNVKEDAKVLGKATTRR